MTIHIIGSEGYIAKRILAKLYNTTAIFDKICKYSYSKNENVYLNLADVKSINMLKFSNNDVVCLLAAVSSPDDCDNKYDYAYNINVIGTKLLIDRALSANAKVLFFSTDAVLGETQNPADEDIIVHPVGAYALMKREIEAKYLKDENFKVFRLSYVFSKLDKFTSYIQECAVNRTPAHVYSNLFRKVIYIDDVVDATIALCSRFKTYTNSLFHIVGNELLSRMDMALLIKANVWNSLDIHETDTPVGFFDKRPAIINATSKYIIDLLGRPPTAYKDAVDQEFGKDSIK